VGLYTSPHLVDVTERIRVGGTPILPAELARWAARLKVVVDGADGDAPVPLTYFEALTVLALCYFVEREVDLAVLEVGLGGRLDATSVVPPKVAVITPIGLDHQAFLGHSLEAICGEKAGIIKPGATVVTNVAKRLFRTVVGPRAFDLRSPIRRAHVDFQYRWLHDGFRYRGWLHRLGPVRLGLAGRYQAQNAALACAAAESLQAYGFRFRAPQIAEGLHRARHPGRLERRAPCRDQSGRQWPAMLLDGSHNPMGAAVLARELLRALPETPRTLLFTARYDKDAAGILRPLARHLDALVVTTPSRPAAAAAGAARCPRAPARRPPRDRAAHPERPRGGPPPRHPRRRPAHRRQPVPLGRGDAAAAASQAHRLTPLDTARSADYKPCPPRAINSAVECYLHTVEVTGSNPVSPTSHPTESPQAHASGLSSFQRRCRDPPGREHLSAGRSVGRAEPLSAEPWARGRPYSLMWSSLPQSRSGSKSSSAQCGSPGLRGGAAASASVSARQWAWRASSNARPIAIAFVSSKSSRSTNVLILPSVFAVELLHPPRACIVVTPAVYSESRRCPARIALLAGEAAVGGEVRE
jgi:folylpolyglutamate synthase/dihydrofolate synthase